MNGPLWLELLILNAGGHVESELAEPEKMGQILCCCAHLECFYFSVQPASSCPPRLSVG